MSRYSMVASEMALGNMATLTLKRRKCPSKSKRKRRRRKGKGGKGEKRKRRRRKVCGSDGTLYESHCELHREACLRGEIAYQGFPLI